MYGFTNDTSRATDIEHIPEGSPIIFYSTGGIKADGDILSYIDNRWTELKDHNWYPNDGVANIMAYYPVIRNASELYNDNNELQDVVYCKTTVSPGYIVNLSFKHLFAKLVININSDVNTTLKNIKVNIPYKINGIDLKNGNLTFSENDNANINLSKNDNGIYEILIPYSDDMTISLDIECEDKTYNTTINNKTYDTGYEYICNIQKSGNKGIYTTLDFITFTHLINGEEEYNGKRLEDFYIEKNGKRIFNLYNNLNFTDKESEEVLRIGMNDNGFKDVFDGNNHTISNIKITSQNINNKSATYVSIFETINTDGYVKNLIIDNCKFDIDSDKYFKVGSIFVGRNNGTIDNCHVKNGNINLLNRKYYGGFVGLNDGYIINSSISGLELESIDGILGIFSYQNNGNIFNCLIKNDINKKADSGLSSNVCINNEMRMYNIFIYGYNDGYLGLCYENEGLYDNCILQAEYKNTAIKNDNETILRNIIYYSDIESEKQNIANKLNEWTETNKSKYDNFVFRRWKTDPTDKVIFE